MRFEPALVRGTLLRRYKRFLADVELAEGEVVVAHCPNSGSMLSVCDPGSEVWLSPADKPGRSLRWSWELIRVGPALVGINTDRPNRLVAEAIRQDRIPELAGYTSLRREVRYGANSRIDLLLESAERPTCLVEVKNVTLRRDLAATAPAEFPDAVTKRGTKHLAELAAAASQGQRAVMLYLAQRPDAPALRLAADIDAQYALAWRIAADAGVESLCYRCEVSTEEVRVQQRIPLEWPEARPK